MPVAKFTKGEKPNKSACVQKFKEMVQALTPAYDMEAQKGDNDHPHSMIWRIFKVNDRKNCVYSGSIPTDSHNEDNVPAALGVINGAITWINGGCL